LHTEGEEGRERRVTWLELFFDLVFVVVIAQLSHALAAHVDIGGAIGFILLFVPVWWIWLSATIYNDRFETEDLSYRTITFLLMVPVAALAIFGHDGLGKGSVGFALAYAAARVIFVALWLRGGRHNPAFAPVANRYAIGFGASVLLFVSSIFVPAPWRFGLWALGLLCDFAAPLTTLHLQARLPRLTASKLVERFGLFTIIVLGEGIVGVVSGVAERESLTPLVALDLVLGLALVFGLWWIYFDFIARRRARRGVWLTLSWSYLHLPLHAAMAATAAGILNVLLLEGATVPVGVRWLLVVALAGALALMGLIEMVLHRDPDEPTDLRLSVGLKLAAAAAVLLLGPLGGALSAPALLGVLLLPLGLQMAYGAYVWFTTPVLESSTAEAEVPAGG
jgi:low temperature requirement protein LtrA